MFLARQILCVSKAACTRNLKCMAKSLQFGALFLAWLGDHPFSQPPCCGKERVATARMYLTNEETKELLSRQRVNQLVSGGLKISKKDTA